MERGRRMNANCTCLVPQELIQEILLRLPVKSLVRFKCVRKSWLSLISNPQFTKLHFDLAAAPSHRLLLKPSGDQIESIDTDATLSDDSARVNLRFPPPPPNLRSPPCLQVFGSCRGFVLLNHEMHELNNFIVWNPSTGVHKRIPDPDSNPEKDEHFLCGIGYDSSKDDYLVILIISVDVDMLPPQPNQPGMIKLFSLKTNSWDCINIIRYFDFPCEGRCMNMAGSFLNGALHWLVFSRDTHRVVILAFDLVERRLYEIPLPQVLNDNPTYYPCDLRVIGGCLGVWCINLEMNEMGEMWLMKEYGVLSSWSRFRFGCDGPFVGFKPICLTQDNALLGSDLGCDRLKKLCGETGQYLSEHFSNRKLGDFYVFKLPCALYRESLLSLPTDTEDSEETTLT